MKREFGFTQARFVLSVCHANAKHPKSRPTEAPRSHSCHPQFPGVRGKPPSDSPACGGKKGGCHAERSEASEIPPNQNTAKPPNLLPQCPRSAPVRRAFRFFASLRMTRVRQGASDPAALQSGRAQGRFANRPYAQALRMTRAGAACATLQRFSAWRVNALPASRVR
jgi:hypothetical protein